jgi:shikimate dehydrogenase
MKVTGNTTIYGVIGYPVRHSYSPIMHNAAYEALGLNCIYIPMEVEPARLQSAIKGLLALGIRGVNITIPYKEDVIPFMDSLSSEASTIGSVNTIVVNEHGKLVGYDTDGDGFINALQEDLQFTCDQKRICILGTGGSSRAVAIYCAKESSP